MITNRPLSKEDRAKLHELELDVVKYYEWKTGNTFMRFELMVLKELVRIAEPAKIKAIVARMHKERPDNFKSFDYIAQPVRNMFKGTRGGKKKS